MRCSVARESLGRSFPYAGVEPYSTVHAAGASVAQRIVAVVFPTRSTLRWPMTGGTARPLAGGSAVIDRSVISAGPLPLDSSLTASVRAAAHVNGPCHT